jgi:hypothetical protein
VRGFTTSRAHAAAQFVSLCRSVIILPRFQASDVLNGRIWSTSNYGVGPFIFNPFFHQISNKNKPKVSVQIFCPTRRRQYPTIQNCQVNKVKEKIFRPLECTSRDRVAISHSVAFLNIPHVLIVALNSFWSYGITIFVKIIILFRCRVHVSHQKYVSFVFP